MYKKVILLTCLLTMIILPTCLAADWNHVNDTHWSYSPQSVHSDIRSGTITGKIQSELTGYVFTMAMDSNLTNYRIVHIPGNVEIKYSDELGKVARSIYDCYHSK